MKKLTMPTLGRNNKSKPDPDPDIATDTSIARTAVATKTTSMLLTAALVCGPIGVVAGGLALAEAAQPKTPAAARTVDLAGERAAASEFAQRVVVAWLTSTSQKHRELDLLVPRLDAGSLPQTAFKVADPQVADIVAGTQPHQWTVKVAATVTDAAGVSGRRYFTVPVLVSGPTITAIDLPAVAAGPAPQDAPDSGYPQIVVTTDPIGEATVQFLTAYLTASSDVGRYVSPGTTMPVPSAMFAQANVLDIHAVEPIANTVPKDGQVARLLVRVMGKVSEQQQLPMSYALTMKARAGRWEVQAIDSAPLYKTSTASPSQASAPAAYSAAPSPSASPSGSPTRPTATPGATTGTPVSTPTK